MSGKLAILFGKITHGVYVVGVTDGRRHNAFTAAWVMQASFNPLLLAFSINPRGYSHRLLKAGGVCSINVLCNDQGELARHFGQPSHREKLSGAAWRPGRTGAPILTEALAYFDCKVSHYCPAGDHEIAVCRVLDGAVMKPQAMPLLYRDTGDMDGSSRLFPEGF